MRLSEAILLGDTLRSRDAWTYLDWQPNKVMPCGCAIGGAVLAVRSDISREEVAKGAAINNGFCLAQAVWPWLSKEFVSPGALEAARIVVGDSWFLSSRLNYPYDYVISSMFLYVQVGKITLEQLVDWVRKYEPAEQGGEETAVEIEEVVYAAV